MPADPSAPLAVAARVIVGVAPLRRAPRPDAGLDTEALMGETLTLFDEDDEGWGEVRLDRDGYRGFMPAASYLKLPAPPATHVVAALRTFVYPTLSIKAPPITWLSLGTPIAVRREAEAGGRVYAVSADGGAIVAHHLRPIGAVETDPVAVAERFLGTPYLWGGRTSLGIDCSGLVQTALAACGIAAPRDSGDQEAALGTAVPLDPHSWRRGDLLFWPGHVALVRDAATLLHANAHTMNVAIEAIDTGLSRIAAAGAPLRAVKRVL